MAARPNLWVQWSEISKKAVIIAYRRFLHDQLSHTFTTQLLRNCYSFTLYKISTHSFFIHLKAVCGWILSFRNGNLSLYDKLHNYYTYKHRISVFCHSQVFISNNLSQKQGVSRVWNWADTSS